jgi:hypothetical protein
MALALSCCELNMFVLHLQHEISARDPQSSLNDIAADSLSVVEDRVPDTSLHNLIAIQTPPSSPQPREPREHAHDANIHCVNYPPNSPPAILPHQHPLAPSATKNSANRAFPCAPPVIGFTMPASTASTPCSLRLAARQTIGFQRTLKPIIGFHVAFYVDVVPCAGAGGLLAGGDETKPTMLRGAAGSLGVIWERRPPVGVGETLLVLVLLSCILTLHCGIHCSLFSLRL